MNIIGRVLDGRYRVDSELGAGGMATAYLAYEESLDRQVVVKVPDPALLQDEGFRKRFQQEIRSLTKLRHPRVVSILAAGEIDGVPYAVMDYLEGGSLRDRMTAGVEEDRVQAVLDWLPAMAEALDFMHGEGVVHRDVKPGNILFDGHGNPFLSDFGIAKALGSADTGITRTGTTVGTAVYMAPEQGLTTDLAGAADQYALGVIVYETLAGRPPIEGETAAILLVRKVTEPPPPISQLAPDLPPAAAEAVMRSLEREVSSRFATCRDFARTFSASLAGDDVGIETAVPIAEATPVADATGTLEQPRVSVPTPPPRAPATPVEAPPSTVAAPAEKSHTSRRAVWWAAALLGVLALVVGLRFYKQSGKGESTEDPPAQPTVLASILPSATLVNDSVWICSGTLTGPGSVELNGVRAAPDASGRFTAKAELVEGQNLLLLRSLDAAGQEVEKHEYRVTLDSTPPMVLVGRMPSSTASRTLTVKGTVNEDGCRISGNGRPAESKGRGFYIEVPLEPGANLIEIQVTDPAGNPARPTVLRITRTRGKVDPGMGLREDPRVPPVKLIRPEGTWVLDPDATREAYVEWRLRDMGKGLDPLEMRRARAEIAREAAEELGNIRLTLDLRRGGSLVATVVNPGVKSEFAGRWEVRGKELKLTLTHEDGELQQDPDVMVCRPEGETLILHDDELPFALVLRRRGGRARPDIPTLPKPVPDSRKLAGIYRLDRDRMMVASEKLVLKQIEREYGRLSGVEREQAIALARQQLELLLTDLQFQLQLSSDGSFIARGTMMGEALNARGRWTATARTITLTTTWEDGEPTNPPDVQTGSIVGGRFHFRIEEDAPLEIVLARL